MRLNRRQILKGAAGTLGVALAGGGAQARMKVGAGNFQVDHVEVALPSLDPAHDGLKVGQLSDMHVGPGTPDGRIIDALAALEREKIDVLLLTGDYVTYRRDPVERVGQLLALRHRIPTFAVLGNHDHWTWPTELRSQLEHADITVLQNRHTVTSVRGAPFTFFGVDDAYSGHEDVDATFRGAAMGGSALVLAHTPVSVRRLPPDRGLFCLSGHTHGGGVYLPTVTPGVFTMAGQPYLRGEYDVGGNRVYVNRGLGFGATLLRPRYGSPPEVSVFTLRCAHPTAQR